MYTGFNKGPRACRPFMTTKLIIRFHSCMIIVQKIVITHTFFSSNENNRNKVEKILIIKIE